MVSKDFLRIEALANGRAAAQRLNAASRSFAASRSP
jgi:hypothetical protein